MNCPWCQNEMVEGVIQSHREVFFTTEPHKFSFISMDPDETTITKHNWTCPTATAYHCAACKKVIVSYE